MVGVEELSDDVALFCPVRMDNSPVHDLRFWEGDLIAEIVADGLLRVAGEVSSDFAAADLISDDKNHFELGVRTIPKLGRKRKQIFRRKARLEALLGSGVRLSRLRDVRSDGAIEVARLFALGVHRLVRRCLGIIASLRRSCQRSEQQE